MVAPVAVLLSIAHEIALTIGAIAEYLIHDVPRVFADNWRDE